MDLAALADPEGQRDLGGQQDLVDLSRHPLRSAPGDPEGLADPADPSDPVAPAGLGCPSLLADLVGPADLLVLPSLRRRKAVHTTLTRLPQPSWATSLCPPGSQRQTHSCLHSDTRKVEIDGVSSRIMRSPLRLGIIGVTLSIELAKIPITIGDLEQTEETDLSREPTLSAQSGLFYESRSRDISTATDSWSKYRSDQ